MEGTKLPSTTTTTTTTTTTVRISRRTLLAENWDDEGYPMVKTSRS